MIGLLHGDAVFLVELRPIDQGLALRFWVSRLPGAEVTDTIIGGVHVLHTLFGKGCKLLGAILLCLVPHVLDGSGVASAMLRMLLFGFHTLVDATYLKLRDAPLLPVNGLRLQGRILDIFELLAIAKVIFIHVRRPLCK